jgi:hypothetical protein
MNILGTFNEAKCRMEIRIYPIFNLNTFVFFFILKDFYLYSKISDSGANPKGIVVDNPTSCLLLLGAVFPFQGSVLFFKSLKPDSFHSVDKDTKSF